MMDAKEFIKELVRMCKSYEETCSDCQISQCAGCPLIVPENVDADMLVSVVEKWSNAHPVVTNGTELMKHLPDSARVLDEWTNGVVIYVPRDWWDAEYKGEE